VIAKVAPLALLAAIAPGTLTAVLLILNGPKPIRLLVTLYAGGLLASVAIGYAIAAGLKGSGAFTGRARDTSARASTWVSACWPCCWPRGWHPVEQPVAGSDEPFAKRSAATVTRWLSGSSNGVRRR
jgi:hypothetical protein